MNRVAWILLFVLFASPALAQDDDPGVFDVNGVFGDNEFGPLPPKVDPLVDVRNWLLRSSAPPLDKKQESPVKKAYDKELKVLSKSFEKRFGVTLETAIAQQAASRGRRGGAAGRSNTAYVTEVRRLSEQLFDTMIAALRVDQQATLRRYQSEQSRVTRLNSMAQTLVSAEVSLTSEQKTEMEALYARESRLRTLIIVEAKGQPHQNKVLNLEAETNEKVEQLLDEKQRNALAEVLAGSNSR